MSAIKVFCLLIILLLTGCDRITDFTDEIAGYQLFEIGATEYELDMSRKDISSLERSLAMNIYPMDTQLSRLLRSLSVRDSYPPTAWKEGVMAEYYWLNEVAVMDNEQNILSKFPDTAIKQLSYEPLFPEALSLKQGRVMLAIEHTPLGSEVLLASSVFRGFEITGLIVVSFDPRTFIAQSAAPGDIILISAHEVVWTGAYDHLRPFLEDIEWENLVSRRISGKIRLDQDDFFWFARAVGEDWLIYIIKEDAAQ